MIDASTDNNEFRSNAALHIAGGKRSVVSGDITFFTVDKCCAGH